MNCQRLFQQIISLMLIVLFLVACGAPPAKPTAFSPTATLTSIPLIATPTPSPTNTPSPVKLGEKVTDGNWEVTCSPPSRTKSIQVVVDLEKSVLLPGTITLKEGRNFLLVDCIIRNKTSITATYTLSDWRTNSTPQDSFLITGIDIARGDSGISLLIPPKTDGWALLSEPLEDPGSGSIFYLILPSDTAAKHPISVAPGTGRKRVLLFVLKDEATNVSFQFRDLPPYRLDK